MGPLPPATYFHTCGFPLISSGSSGLPLVSSSDVLVPVPRGQSALIFLVPLLLCLPVLSVPSCLLFSAPSPILQEQEGKKGYHTCMSMSTPTFPWTLTPELIPTPHHLRLFPQVCLRLCVCVCTCANEPVSSILILLLHPPTTSTTRPQIHAHTTTDLALNRQASLAILAPGLG